MIEKTDTFRIKLREAIDATDYTQEGLAREIDVTLRTVQFWLGGQREPKGRQLVRLADALDREPSWFYLEPEEEIAA